MAFVAQGLQIVPIPEKLRIAFVRPDVVNVCRWRDTSALPAFLAQRMPAQECRPSFLPRVAVAPLGGRASPLGSPLVPRGLQPGIALLALLLMPPAVPNAQRHWRMAAWVSANMEKRHIKKNPRICVRIRGWSCISVGVNQQHLHAVSYGCKKAGHRPTLITSCVFRLLVPSIVSHYFIFSRAIPSVELQDIRKHDRSAVNLLIEPSFA